MIAERLHLLANSQAGNFSEIAAFVRELVKQGRMTSEKDYPDWTYTESVAILLRTFR